MSAVALVTASTTSLPADVIDTYQITVLPFTIQFLHGNYKENVDLSLSEFYSHLAQAEAIPTTAPMSVPSMIQMFTQIGHTTDTILVFHIAQQLTAAWINSQQAAELVPTLRVINIDTRTTSIGAGLQIIEAAEALRQGASVDAVLTLLQELQERTLMLFVPASMRYLRMSGRVGRLPAMAAALFGVYAVIGLGSAGMQAVTKARSLEAAHTELLEQVAQFVGPGRARRLGIVHTNAPECAAQFQTEVAARFPGVPIIVADAGAMMAVHTGPGALGLAVIRDT